ncbi:DUF6174 domain-containing protein [Nocardioides daeguensis]|uniref:Lipoprotein n=1 Tax=Nocardioides daeguensis TaxID=908359 RepID=A0ABP6VVM7_9ACTN|nr:DUF6174 domain-containing protein [Nocardioides daeguensis]MBV6728408.1 hypothetical protein [Nocardioides daeguensis]MCR1773832.1 hypothetical protein [Nocardioides daeguensis]
MRLAAVTAALTVPLLLTASACSHESDRAADPTAAASTPDGTATASGTPGTPGTASYPAYGVPDYTYHLEVLCYCPQTGTVEVVVHDGEVTSATSLDGPRAGTPAPDFARLSIDDIIEQANSPAIAKARVRWPDGQDHPDSVMIDRIAQAIDDEVTYTIKDVQVTSQE